tara:strand:+ start:175 stop:1542 length:1368 start_codon:yes stop_codon:yes gene_type:complete
MARPKVRLAMLLVLVMFMSGCIYSTTPEWGTGDGQLKVEIDGDKADIKSQLGEGYEESVDLIKCDDQLIKVTGLLISAMVYEAHPDDNSIESAMGAAVIIHTMTWSQAEAVETGTAGKVALKDWTSPINPAESGGSEITNNEDDWEVIGIIPGSENIANGLNVLDHWHQPIELTGYVVDASGLGTLDADNCKKLDGQGHGMVITKIRAEEGTVSLDGESDDEYLLGDTDIFGRVSFILFFIVVGLGGGLGLYTVSTMVIRQGAKSTAETLLGREGFAKAVQMKKDLRRSKKDGLESTAERAAKQKKTSPPPKKKKTEEAAISGFSLDSILSSEEESGPQSFGSGGSVVVTSEAENMVSQPVVSTSSTPITSTPMPSSNVVSSQPEPAVKRGHFSATMTSNVSQTPKPRSEPTENKPVKRRAVKKRAAKAEAEPEPVPENKVASVADNEEFSDFSF